MISEVFHSFTNLCPYYFTAQWSPPISCWWTRSCEPECLLSKVKGQLKKRQLLSYSQELLVTLNGSVNKFPLQKLWSASFCWTTRCKHHSINHYRNCHVSHGINFSWICHCLPLIGLFIWHVKSTDLWHQFCFYPLKIFLETLKFVFV